MIRMFARHKVKDFASWKVGYDAFEPMQKQANVVAEAVFQAADDPNDVTVVHDFNNLQDAQAFAGSPELKQGMQELGVIGPPDIWFTNHV